LRENNQHGLNFTTEHRREASSPDLTANQLGSFSFNSLADLDAGRAPVCTRQLTPRARSENQWIGGMSLGDSYRPTDDLQLQYGVRRDGNRFFKEALYDYTDHDTLA